MKPGVVPPRALRSILAAAPDEWRTTPFYRMMLRGADPDRVVQWGRDVRVGDFERGMEIVRGAWRIGGERLAGMNALPWAAPAPSAHFTARLHSFSWLGDVAAVGVAGHEAIAALVQSWVVGFGADFHASAWAPELVAERLYAWLCHGRAAFDRAEEPTKTELLRSLGRQARHLSLALDDIRAPLSRVKAGAALVLAGASGMPEGERLRELGEETLDEACAAQLLPDGGHATRSPDFLMEFVCDLLTASDALKRQGFPPPTIVRDCLPRAAAMLTFFRMSDGRLAAFNGGGEGSAATLREVLAEIKASRSFEYATQSGYQRLAAGDVTLLMDVGSAPQPSYGERAHAGALAFEMSTGSNRLIVNVGSAYDLAPEWRAAGRATNGHSTLVIEDALSAAFQQRRGGRGAAVPTGPQVTQKRTREEDGDLVEAHHDGYRQQFGYLHRRRIFLAKDGRRVWGQESVAPPLSGAGKTPLAPVAFAVRFHLHPLVRVERADVHEMVLHHDEVRWRFATDARRLAVEPSIHLGGGQGPQRSRQIVLYGVTEPNAPEDKAPNLVRWKLSRFA